MTDKQTTVHRGERRDAKGCSWQHYFPTIQMRVKLGMKAHTSNPGTQTVKQDSKLQASLG